MARLRVMAALTSLLVLCKSPRTLLSLLACGCKVVRFGAEKLGITSEASEIETLLTEVITSIGGNLAASDIDRHLQALPEQQLDQANAHLVRFTGVVLQALVTDALSEPEFAPVTTQLSPAVEHLPAAWASFIEAGHAEAQPLAHQDFVLAIAHSLQHHEAIHALDPALLGTFFAVWIRGRVSEQLVQKGWHEKLAHWVSDRLGTALASSLVTEHPAAQAAFKKSLLRFHTESLACLHEVSVRVTSLHTKADETTAGINKANGGIESISDTLLKHLGPITAPARIKAYNLSLLTAFHSYQELALDNYAVGNDKCPDIWDIFVHPACATDYLTPEAMDKAQGEEPQRALGSELLPILGSHANHSDAPMDDLFLQSILGSDRDRRHVLLADPGMGKSTLIQSLIAHLASGRPLAGAPALTGLLPVPLILRDLVPLLPQAQPEAWTWDSLIHALLKDYQREENGPRLLATYHGHEDEFRALIHGSEQVFFLVDGLDEIGDIDKRRHLVRALQEGIRTADKGARWLITSRVIGYNAAPVDEIRGRITHNNAYSPGEVLYREVVPVWGGYGLDAHYDSLPDGQGLCSTGYQFDIAHRLYLAPFDDQRQNAFTQRWFKHRASLDHSQELLREVRRHGHDGVRVIARVPNLLCMMNMLKRSGKPLPDGRYALYDEIVKAYNGGIDSSYFHNKQHDITCPIDPPERRFLLALLGAQMQQTRTTGIDQERANQRKKKPADSETKAEGNILITRLEIESLLVPAIETLRQNGKIKSQRSALDVLDELLHHIACRSGLLIPRSTDAQGRAVYGFTHLSFLEFFAAEWLGLEFDRQRNRLARKAEAAAEEQTLTEADLDREFPAHGPIQHQRGDFPALAAAPTWHEPLIFLVEARPGDTSTLLRWLFPALHSAQPYTVPEEKEKAVPLMPLGAVALAVKLAQDQELKLPMTTRQHWWRTLWRAKFLWPLGWWEDKGWHIAPLLLQRQELQDEVLYCLAEEQPKYPDLPLQLIVCPTLTSRALQGLARLVDLRKLWLGGCTGLVDTDALVGLSGLRTLDLKECTGLQGSRALQGLAGLVDLQELWLTGCTGLVDTDALVGLSGLRTLYLQHCTGLQGSRALQGLAGLVGLEELWLTGCTGLSEADVAELRRSLGEKCIVHLPR